MSDPEIKGNFESAVENTAAAPPPRGNWVHLNIDVTVETADPRFNQAVKDTGANVGQDFLDHVNNDLDRLAGDIADFTNQTRDSLPPVWVYSDYEGYSDIFPEAAHLYEEQGDPHRVERHEGEPVLRKTEPNAVPDNQEFFDDLKAQGINNVVVTGLYADICVLETVENLQREGFNVMVVEDLVDTNLPESRVEGMQKLRDSGARMVTQEELMQGLQDNQLDELYAGTYANDGLLGQSTSANTAYNQGLPRIV